MKKNSNAAKTMETAVVAPQASAGITLTAEQFQQLLDRAAGPQTQVKTSKRFPHSNRRPRDVVMLSFQCDAELAAEMDKMKIQLEGEGKVRSLKEARELVWREGLKALRQASKAQ